MDYAPFILGAVEKGNISFPKTVHGNKKIWYELVAMIYDSTL